MHAPFPELILSEVKKNVKQKLEKKAQQQQQPQQRSKNLIIHSLII